MKTQEQLTAVASDISATPEGFVSWQWTTYCQPFSHEFDAIACPDDEGYSVFALHYPGVISQGETIEEARANIAEAFSAVLASRRKHGEPMEYSARPTVDESPECKRIRVVIHA